MVDLKSEFIRHDSHDIRYRKPFGAVSCGTEVCLSIDINTSLYISYVDLHLVAEDGMDTVLSMRLDCTEGSLKKYTACFNASEQPGLIWYYFKAGIGGVDYFYGNNQFAYGGAGSIANHIPVYYQITVYKDSGETPDWYKHAIMYQIFPDRFFNGNKDGKVSNPKKSSFVYSSWNDSPCYVKDCDTGSILRWDFFGGNLEGIIQKLDYLKELGITVIYLNPIFESHSNHRYDTADYKNVDNILGDNETFRRLCEIAKEHGISIILDGVFSHTGSDSIYFNKYGSYPELGAYQSNASKYYSWYRFKSYPKEYECWWGIDNMPNVDEMNPAYRQYIISGEDSVIKHWMKLGAKGWRLDVADELPDAFIKEIKEHMKKTDKESVLIGEVWEDASNKISYGERRRYLMGEELDSVMNYPFRNHMIDFILGHKAPEQVSAALMSLKENYPTHNFYSNMNFVGTHDVPRILTVLGEAPDEGYMTWRERESYRLNEASKSLAIKRLKLISLVQMTFPGVPSIYYGDEAGLEGYKDPLNRRTYPWGNENKELLDWYKTLVALRKSKDAFSTGEYIPLLAEGDVFAYIRRIIHNKDAFGKKAQNGTAVVLLNRSRDKSTSVKLDLSSYGKGGRIIDLLDESTSYEVLEGAAAFDLKALEGRVLFWQVGEDE